MPIYEYECAACGHQHEALQKIGEPPLRDCPDCGRTELVKLVSAAGFRLGGSGWYETDFKTGDKRNLVASDTGSAKDGEGAKGKQGRPGSGKEGKAAAGKDTASPSGVAGAGQGKGSTQGSTQGSARGSTQGSTQGSGEN